MLPFEDDKAGKYTMQVSLKGVMEASGNKYPVVISVHLKNQTYYEPRAGDYFRIAPRLTDG